MTINTATLSGRLGSDPVARMTPSGTQVLEFSIAVNEGYRGEDGTYKERPSWFKCVMFGKRADALSKILQSGMKVTVSGRLHQERWEKNGESRSSVSLRVDELELMQQRGQR